MKKILLPLTALVVVIVIAFFAMNVMNQEEIEILQPTQNDVLEAGQDFNIVWSSEGVESVDIYFGLENEDSFSKIAQGVSGDLGEYNWLVPDDLEDTNVKIHIVKEGVEPKDSDVASTSVTISKKEIVENDEFCGTSTLGECSTDEDCVIDGCSAEVCRSVNEEPVITPCIFKDCFVASEYNKSCVCVENQCQWD